MRTITLAQPGQLALIDTPEPPLPSPGEALLRVHRVGICGTDLHAYRGRQPFFEYPRILGHELGVEVIATGADVTNVSPGDRCAVEPYLNCGVCIACRRGKTNCCAALLTLGVHCDGGMRDHIVLPARKLHVANDLSYETLALIETLCIGAHAVSRAAIAPDETVLVIGAGPIGLAVLQFAALEAKHVIVADANPARLAFAARLGASSALKALQVSGDFVDKLREETAGDLPTVVFDATGSAASMNNAFHLVAPGGKLVFVGLVQDDITFSDPHLHRREITLLASRNALASDFTHVLALTRAGQIDTAPWITHRATPEALPDAVPEWLKPETATVKAMLVMV
jgi:2-desacetyl-2-hydroxyethyl bacteriochlorophyllide A dehydrogenase